MRQVVPVLVCQRRCRQTATQPIDTLVVAQRASHLHGTHHARAGYRTHAEADLAVVEQQRVSRTHVARQARVRDSHALSVARVFRQARVEHELLTLGQLDRAVAKALNANLGALQITEYADVPAHFHGDLAYLRDAPLVLLPVAVREVDANDIDARFQQACHDAGIISCRAESRDNLGAAHRVPGGDSCRGD